MEYEEFVELVCDAFGLDRSEVNEETSFLHDLGIDSLSLANFIIKLEHQYQIKIKITNVWDLTSMRDAYEQFTHALATVESPGDGIKE